MAKRTHDFGNTNQELCCPLCKEPLTNHTQRSLACTTGHSFDFAKEGYVHLLPVNKKNSKVPGDDAMMITARAAFLEAGYYTPLVTMLKQILTQSTAPPKATALDIGCGSGYYTKNVICQSMLFDAVLAMDISKHAVKAAAKKHDDAFYFVSSAFDLPIRDHSIDVALSVFAPVLSSEISRVLQKNGSLIIVTPGPNHLKEVAEVIYDKFRPHTNSTHEKLGGDFVLKSSQILAFEISLKESSNILDLVKMTPYYWNKDIEKVKKFEAIETMSVKCEFQIDLFSPR